MKQLNCTTLGPVFEPQHFPHPKEQFHPAICSFSGSLAIRYCSIFGDPHLRTFDGIHQTCRINGAWPLVDNEYFSVQVTSESVGHGEATAVTKVSVVFFYTSIFLVANENPCINQEDVDINMNKLCNVNKLENPSSI